MVSTPKGCTDNSQMTHNPSMSTKNTSVSISLCKFIDTLDIKHKNTVCRFGATKEKSKEICCSRKSQRKVVIEN